MTLHAAKGLELPFVFIPGCEEGLLTYGLYPGQDTDVAEEQRLLYVGMTRAQQGLTLTWAKSRQLHNRPFTLAPSPFLATIKQTLVEHRTSEYKKKTKATDPQLSLFE